MCDTRSRQMTDPMEAVRTVKDLRMYNMGTKATFDTCMAVLAQSGERDKDEWGRDEAIRLDRYSTFYVNTGNEDIASNKKKRIDQELTREYTERVLRVAHPRYHDTSSESRGQVLLREICERLKTRLLPWCDANAWDFMNDLVITSDGAAVSTLPTDVGLPDSTPLMWPEVSLTVAFRHAHLQWAFEELEILTALTVYEVKEDVLWFIKEDAAAGRDYVLDECEEGILKRIRTEVARPDIARVRADVESTHSDLVTWGLWHTNAGRTREGTLLKNVRNGIVQPRNKYVSSASTALTASATTMNDTRPFYVMCSRMKPFTSSTDFRVKHGFVLDLGPDKSPLRCTADVFNVRVMGPFEWRRGVLLDTLPSQHVDLGGITTTTLPSAWQRDMGAMTNTIDRVRMSGFVDAHALFNDAQRAILVSVAASVQEHKSRSNGGGGHDNSTVSPRHFLAHVDHIRMTLALGDDVPVKCIKQGDAPVMDALWHGMYTWGLRSIEDAANRKKMRSVLCSAAMKVSTALAMSRG